MKRRRLLTVLGATAVVVAVPSGLVLARDADATKSTPAASSSTATTAKVTRRDLSERVDYDGTLGYGDTHDVSVSGGGVVTALPAVGTVVDRGQTIAEVDGRPVVLFFGDRPLWRALDAGSDAGADIEEVEANLIALGYASEAQLGPDTKWTAATTAAIKRWQKALGVEQTGALDPSAVVITSGPVRVSKHLAEPGARAGAPVLETTGTAQLVSMSLPASRQASLKVGDSVHLTLPDGSATTGTVSSVGSVATSQQGGDPTVPVVVTLASAAVGAGLDQAPVKVGVTTTSAIGVLAVPVEALLALAEGGYAVERSDGSLVGVTLGAFADGWVQVTGDVREGDVVVAAQ